MGPGGWRSAPQDEHFWMTSLWSFAASNQKALSRFVDGRGRLGFAAAFSRGLNFRIRNVMVPTSSPAWSRNSVRVVTKWPTPRPVAFSSDTPSMNEVVVRWSPGTSSRRYSCSVLVATTDVKPASSSRLSSRLCSVSSRGPWDFSPFMGQTWSMTAGATTPSRPDATAASSSRYTGFVSPMASTQWRIIGRLTGSSAATGGPTCRPSNSRSSSRNAISEPPGSCRGPSRPRSPAGSRSRHPRRC